jgi:hypothetical protein
MASSISSDTSDAAGASRPPRKAGRPVAKPPQAEVSTRSGSRTETRPRPAQTQPAKVASTPPGKNGSAEAGSQEGDEATPVVAAAGGTQLPSFAVSMLVHIVALLALALIVNAPPKLEPPRLITSSAPETEEEFAEEFEEPPEEFEEVEVADVTEAVVMPEAVTAVEDVVVESLADDVDAAAVSVELTDFSTETAPSSDLLQQVGAIGGKAGGLGGRSGSQRAKLVQAGGGNKQSEQAVEAALKWIALHQMPDGGWDFDLKNVPSCGGQCSHGGGGGKAERGAATSMALLPFLGRGYTHREGPYKKQIEAGLGFLASITTKQNGKAYLPGGNMYSQGLAGIVLSEAYAMTQDQRLGPPAQLALNFIMSAQDPVGGGWRYSPRQPGDTSAVGWQLMALKSGHMAYLNVNPVTVKKAIEFLNTVQADDGAQYGYTGPGGGYGTSAVGLLCRMYLGWKKDNPALQRGVDRIAKKGPSHDLYYDYYATQVMHHVEGERWIAWNTKMRDGLVKAQHKVGHEAGSWYDSYDGGHGAHVAGRLYCTSLATMILEVYYRHLPIYGKSSVEEEFKE